METVKRTYRDSEIDLMEVFRILLSRWKPIVIAGLAAAILAGAGTKLFITPKYTATASMYVYTNPKGTESGVITSSELAAADNLIKTYKAIVKSNAILSVISAQLNQELLYSFVMNSVAQNKRMNRDTTSESILNYRIRASRFCDWLIGSYSIRKTL